MFEREEYWIDEETGRWIAADNTWNIVTSGKTRDEAANNLAKVRELHIENLCVQ